MNDSNHIDDLNDPDDEDAAALLQEAVDEAMAPAVDELWAPIRAP